MITLLLLACTGEKIGDTATATADTAPGAGTLALTFAMDTDYIDSMDEAPIGDFHGSIFRGEDVSGAGPEEGAEALEDVYVAGVDLTGGGPTAVLYTTGELPGGEVVILGFMDSDANAEASAPSPDRGDPVTLPGDNDFDVDAGETPIEVYFGFLNP